MNFVDSVVQSRKSTVSYILLPTVACNLSSILGRSRMYASNNSNSFQLQPVRHLFTPSSFSINFVSVNSRDTPLSLSSLCLKIRSTAWIWFETPYGIKMYGEDCVGTWEAILESRSTKGLDVPNGDLREHKGFHAEARYIRSTFVRSSFSRSCFLVPSHYFRMRSTTRIWCEISPVWDNLISVVAVAL